jgi:hypothetical protein
MITASLISSALGLDHGQFVRGRDCYESR